MPLNYLQLQPQIEQYSQRAVLNRQDLDAKLKIALDLLHICGRQHGDIRSTLNEKITGSQRGDRSALLSNEPANSAVKFPRIRF